MNWKQLHTAATPAEREELLIMMFRTIEARKQRLILARGRLLRERRRAARLHFINERRMPYTKRLTRALVNGSIFFIIATLSVATWIIAAHIQPVYGAPLLFGYSLILIAALAVKPYKRISLTLERF